MYLRPKKNRDVKPYFPFEAKPLKPRTLFWIMPLWVAVVFLMIFSAIFTLVTLSESTLDHALKWVGWAGN